MNRRLLIPGGVILLLFITAWIGPEIAPYPHDFQDSGALLLPPSARHLLGTDRLGRDLFSRILYGTRISMGVALFASLSALVIGTLYGGVSGLLGGNADNLMMRLVDVFYAIPDILLIILLSELVGRGGLGIIVGLSLVSWVTVARLIRGEVLRLKEEAYVEAARALGAARARILLRHILPNTLGVLIVTLTFRIPAAILTESTLSFIGLGLAPPAASWGTLANEGWSALKFHPHLIIFPSLAILITMLAFNFFGDALRDLLDPGRRVHRLPGRPTP